MKKIIIVEGCDGSGKTTLAMDLAKRMRAVFLKCERPQEGVDLMRFDYLLQTATVYSGVVVADRHVAISEPIYGMICRGKHDLKEKEIEECLSRVSHIVYCRPSSDQIKHSIGVHDHMEGVVDNLPKIIVAYDDFFLSKHTWRRGFGPAVHRYDWTKDKITDLMSELK